MTKNPSHPDTLAADLLPRLSRLNRTLARSATGLSRTQISVLVTLRDEGPTRISALAVRERVAQPSMTSLANRLERQGLIERQADPADGRAVPVSITPAGREALAAAVAGMQATLARQIHELSPNDRQTLHAMLPIFDRLTMTHQEHPS
ncbi:MAG: MarR family winged helix-turn-helix transcriptional regulator [Gaiellales bacterium]